MTRFDDSFLQASLDRVLALQKRLSRGALEELAREVMLRLSVRKTDRVPPGQGPEIDALCRALIAESSVAADDMMLDLQADGQSLDTLYARYLAPAAEKLGHMWDRDEITFLQVTLGTGRIYDLVRLLRDQLPPPRIMRNAPILFATVPGEQHGVGVEMAAELFRQRGWDVSLMVGAGHDEILERIDSQVFLILGLSSGGHATAGALARLIHAVRVAHPQLYIIVSGRIVEEEPDLLGLIGPDSAVATVEDALAAMDTLSGEMRSIPG